VTFLLDTNVVSEWTRPSPHPAVVRWLREVDEDDVLLSVVTLAELRHGVDRLAGGERRRRLDHWLSVDLVERFDGRIVDVDRAVGDSWGRLVAAGESRGTRPGAVDALIAATADVHGAVVVTRNVRDFHAMGTRVLDPWTA
jgi:toxin FitB